MTGKEVLAVVREALTAHASALSCNEGQTETMAAVYSETTAALDGCVLLTREEAADIRWHLQDGLDDFDRMVDLLTPTKEDA